MFQPSRPLRVLLDLGLLLSGFIACAQSVLSADPILESKKRLGQAVELA